MTAATEPQSWEILFVHGFGGIDENPAFVTKAKSFLGKSFKKDQLPLNIRTHSWDSESLGWLWQRNESSLCRKWGEAMNSVASGPAAIITAPEQRAVGWIEQHRPLFFPDAI